MNDITASLDTARAAQSQQSGQDVQSKLAGLNSSRLSPEAKEKKLREACEGFESIFIQKMWQEMRKSVHQSSLLHGKEEQFWQDMYDQELAKKMTSAGGIGLANMMYEQLSSHLTSASRTTAMASGPTRAFVPSQAPLMGDAVSENASIPLTYEEEIRPQQSQGLPLYEKAESIAPLEVTPPAASRDKSAALTTPAPVRAEAPAQAPERVDPQVEQALASMRIRVEQQIPPQNLASVSYSEPHRRQQPVASGLERANAVRRQAGDQLGSRGVREPLLPQTENARAATEQASLRREARMKQRAEQREARKMQPKPYSFPRGQAEAQDAEAQAAKPSQPVQADAKISETQAAWLAPENAEVFAPMNPVENTEPSQVKERSLDARGAAPLNVQAELRARLMGTPQAPNPVDASAVQNNAQVKRSGRTAQVRSRRARDTQEIRTLNLGGGQTPQATSSLTGPSAAQPMNTMPEASVPGPAASSLTGPLAAQPMNPQPEVSAPGPAASSLTGPAAMPPQPQVQASASRPGRAETSGAQPSYTIPPLTAQDLRS